MKVRAIAPGYYNHCKRTPGKKGEIFTLKRPEDFSKKWMEKVDEDAPAFDGPSDAPDQEEMEVKAKGRGKAKKEVEEVSTGAKSVI